MDIKAVANLIKKVTRKNVQARLLTVVALQVIDKLYTMNFYINLWLFTCLSIVVDYQRGVVI